MPAAKLSSTNKTAQILAAAEKGGHGVVAAIAYAVLKRLIIGCNLTKLQIQHRANNSLGQSRRERTITFNPPILPLGNNVQQWPPDTYCSHRSESGFGPYLNPFGPLSR